MKKFILKTLIFILPFIILYIVNIFFWEKDKGDLTRAGYLYGNSSHEKFENILTENKYTNISELNLKNNNKFNILTIGDSFSGQGILGYQNYLAHKNISVLDFGRFTMGENVIQKLINLLNGDFFDKINVNYVILQGVERLFLYRKSMVINSDSEKTNISELLKEINPPKNNLLKIEKTNEIKLFDEEFFSDLIIKIPLTNISYFFKDNPRYSLTYKVSSTKKMFTRDTKSILFAEEDILFLNDKNDSIKIAKCNDLINDLSYKLQKRNIKLMLLIAPDKYDLYFNYFENKNKYEKPMFFKYLDSQKKDYLYIDSYAILSKAIKSNKDVYYYSDTHWSPIAANLIAEDIYNMIFSTL